ncbi:hypothetical protein QUB08_29225 [Microcoleus sp. BR0-C5]|uniref:hypothetical protein n=1 Tax=Microcoleus sp. BR0-C5 TaxID=2818713 RepID=UPI002FD446BE
MISTYLISVRPKWADAFFLDREPKTIEFRKGNFGASLKPGDTIAIYSTMPVAELIGTVRVSMREALPISELWQLSQQGKLARISEAQFNAYYANQSSGIGVWVDSAELLPKPIPLYRLREEWRANWNPPQQIQKLTSEQLAFIKGK